MKRVHSIALSSITAGVKYRKTIKNLSNVHIKLYGIKKVVPVIYMGFMDSSSDQNIKMNDMIRQFIELEGTNQIKSEYYSFMIYTTHNFKVMYFGEVIDSSTKPNYDDTERLDQEKYLKLYSIIPICGSMFYTDHDQDGMILYGIRTMSNFVQMSLGKFVIQAIQVFSLWFFKNLNITVLLHDSDVNIFKSMGFKRFEIDDVQKINFIKHNYVDRGISEIEESCSLYRLDHMIDTKPNMNTSYGIKYIKEWQCSSSSNFGTNIEKNMRKYIQNSVQECLHFKPFICEEKQIQDLRMKLDKKYTFLIPKHNFNTVHEWEVLAIHQIYVKFLKKQTNAGSGDILCDELIKASVTSYYKSKNKNVTINIGDVMNNYWAGFLEDEKMNEASKFILTCLRCVKIKPIYDSKDTQSKVICSYCNMKICSINFDRENVSSPELWYTIFTKLSVEHLFGIKKEGENIISIHECKKVSSNILEILTKNIYDANMVHFDIIEEYYDDFKGNFFNLPHEYIMTWCGFMPKIADYFQESYEFWFSTVEKEFRKFIQNQPSLKTRKNEKISNTDSEVEHVDDSEHDSFLVTEDNIQEEYINDLFKDIGDCKSKDDVINVKKSKNQHTKDVTNDQKMLKKMNKLEYYLPQLRTSKTMTLPLCLHRKYNIHNFDTEKAYWIGYYPEKNSTCCNCQIMSVSYMRNKAVFDMKELFIIKEKHNEPIPLRRSTIANIRKDYEETYGDVEINVIYKI